MANRNIGNLQATLSLNASGWNKGFKSALAPIKSFTDGIKSVGTVAAGVLTAGAISGVIDNIKNVGKAAFSTVSNMQRMEKQIQSLSAAEIVKASNGMMNYSDAIGAAGKIANETIDYIRNLSIVSPYSNQTVLSAFQMNAAMGQSVNQAKVTTKAILTLGAGMGMTEQEMSGFAAALAQTGATGRITAADLRQFANNRFGLDKMNAVFERMSKATKVNISTYEDFNKAVASGKVTTDDFYKALAKYAEQNYGGAVELMSNTLDGLESTMGDIKEYALGDMFKPLGDSFAKAFAPIVGGLADFLGVGGFKDFGEKIAKWAKPGLDAIEKFGKNITGKRIKQVLKDVQQYLGDTAKSGISLKAILEATFGEKAGGAIFGFFEKLRKPLAWINEHKDAIIGGIKGMAIAFGTLTVIGTVSGLLSALLNPLNLVLAAAGLLGAAWSTNFMGMRDKTQELIEKIQPAITATKDYIKGISDTFKETGVSGVIEKIKTDVIGLIPDSVIQAVGDFKNTISNLIPEPVKEAARILGEKFAEYKKILVDEGLGATFTQLKTDLSTLVSNGTVRNIVSLSLAILAIVNPIAGIAASLAAIGLTVATWGENPLGLHVSSYASITESFHNIKESLSRIREALSSIFGYSDKDSPIDTLGKDADDNKQKIDALSLVLEGLATALESIIGSIADFVESMASWKTAYDTDGIGGLLKKTKDDFITFGDEVVDNPVQGIGKVAKGLFKFSSPLGFVQVTTGEALAATAKHFEWFGNNAKVPAPDTTEYMKVLGQDNTPFQLKGLTEKTFNQIEAAFAEQTGYVLQAPDVDGYIKIIDPASGTIVPITESMLEMLAQTFSSITGIESESILPFVQSIQTDFETLSDELVGHSIIPDMISDVNTEFSGWWEKVEPGVSAVTNGIIERFTELKIVLQEIVSSLTSGISINSEAESLAGNMGETISGGGFLDQIIKPIPEEVLTSYQAFSDKVTALNLVIPTLNLNLGAASGLLFALTSVATYLSGDATAAFTEFAAFISIGGTFGLALDTLIKMFSLDGGLGLKQTMMLVAEYMAGDFTTTFTNFGTFISIGGTFGDALDKLIKTLSQDGNASSLKQTMEKVADYIKGTWTNRFKDFEKHLNEKTMPTYKALSKLLYYGTNTVYNAYGNVLGVLESIYKVLGDISNRLRGSFKRALDDSIDPMGKFEGAAQNVATVCSNIAAQATAAAMAIADLINQMSALDGVDLPSAGGGKKGGGKPKPNESARAKGGPVSGGTTYLVGERGPELFTPRRSGWIIPNDEAFGDNGASGGKQTILNINAPIYGEDHLRQLIRSEVKRGLREAEFHGIA